MSGASQPQMQKETSLDRLCINAIRALSMDAVQKANSGHPGAPMEMAPMAYLLWSKYLRYNPENPSWCNRDRFVLSSGHASMLQYAVLHLAGYDLSLDDIKNFRQWGSKTPGHPESSHTPGVEMWTGPLGQGVATATGMAAAARWAGEYFNRPDHQIVDYRVFTFMGDGCMMEGISHEACSLAGHLRLNNLIAFYSDNRISIDGSTDLAFTEDVATRFRGYDWFVVRAEGDNLAELSNAIDKALAQKERPSLIIVKNHIGYGSPNRQDTSKAHGEPLGDEEIKLTKTALDWPEIEPFKIPKEVYQAFEPVRTKCKETERNWRETFNSYKKSYPELAKTFENALAGNLPEGWDAAIPDFVDAKAIATRDASGKVMNALAAHHPLFLGGSADLAPSTKTYLDNAGDFNPEMYAGQKAGRNFFFGVREFAMTAFVNGMALSGLVRPFGATFFVFIDYMRPAVRLAALMKTNPIFVLTHDSVGVGEDGPTHQPIEQLASLRCMPNVLVLRPADATETAAAWRIAVQHKGGPICLVLTRQKLPVLDRKTLAAASLVEKGAYILSDVPQGKAIDLILLASGSEVSLVLDAQKVLCADGIHARVVSMPSWELFAKQPQPYRESVLPAAVSARLGVEMASSFGWHRWVGDHGDVICLDHFGASAPAEVLFKEFGFTVENVVQRARTLVKRG